MNEFFKKFKPIEKEISDKKGDFELFAILLREDAPDKWDMVLSAPWLKKEDRSLLEYMTLVLKEHLKEDVIKLSRVVILDNSHPALKAIHKAIGVKHGGAEIQDSNFFGLQIKHGYIITSKSAVEIKKVKHLEKS
jgi:hypothetical protein